MLPVRCLEARLFLPLPLLVPLLHLALAHPAWGQKDGVIPAHYGSYRQEGEGGALKTESRGQTQRGRGERENTGETIRHLISDQRTFTDSPPVEQMIDAALCFITRFDSLHNVWIHPCLMTGKEGLMGADNLNM